MKVLSLPRLPDYKALWVCAKDWRLTNELPSIERSEPPVDGQAEEGNGLPPLPSGRRSGRHKRRISPFTAVMFEVGKLQAGGRGGSRVSVREEPEQDEDGGIAAVGDAAEEYKDDEGDEEEEDEEEEQQEEEQRKRWRCQDRIPKLKVPPRLGVRILERRRVSLNKDGSMSIAKEELLSLVEGDYPGSAGLKRLELKFVAKAQALMRSPMMPCLAPNNRGDFPGWPEPIRDRYKDWRDDPELRFLYTKGLDDLVVGSRTRKWFNHGELKLGKYNKETKQETGGYEISSHGDLLQRERLCRYACMISQTHCILTIHGVGIHGRLIIPGNTKPRFLEIEAYTPHNSKCNSLRFHAEKLEAMFTGQAEEDADLLRPGNKLRLLRELCRMMHFEYQLTETFLTADEETGEEARSTITTRFRHTERWPFNPYTWDPSDEVDPREKERADAYKAAAAEAKRMKRSALQRRRKIEQCQREERIAQGLPPEDPDPLRPLGSLAKAAAGKQDRHHANKHHHATPAAGGAAGKLSRLMPALRSKAQAVGNVAVFAGHKSQKGPWKRRVAVKMEEFLCLDTNRQVPLNMAAMRRRQLREMKRALEQDAERKRLKMLTMPPWRRGLEVARAIAISGFDCMATAVRKPETPTIIALRVYDRRHCTASMVRINIGHLARLVHLSKRCDKWDKKEARTAYVAALRRLRLQRSQSETTPPGGASMLHLEGRSSEDIPLLSLQPVIFSPRLPFHSKTVHACLPRAGVDARDKTYLQRLDSSLGGELSTRGHRTFKPRCRPRREVGMEGARRMAGGAAKVHGVHCLFSLWWTGSLENEGQEVFLMVYTAQAITTAGGYSPPFSNHRLPLSWEDVRCGTIGTGLVDVALQASSEDAIAALRAERQLLIDECDREHGVLKGRLVELEEDFTVGSSTSRGASSGDDNRVSRLSLVERAIDANRAKRAELKTTAYEAAKVAKAEAAWDGIGRLLLGHCRWVNVRDVMNDCKIYEAVVAERLPFVVEPNVAPTLSLRYSTRIYHHVHRIKNLSTRSFPEEATVRVHLQVFQKRESLYFVAHEPLTCGRYRYMYESELHLPMITGWHGVTTPLERTVQLSLCLDSLCFMDKVREEDGVEEIVLTQYNPESAGRPVVAIDEEILGDLKELGDLLDAVALKPKGRAAAGKTARQKETGSASRPGSAASRPSSAASSEGSKRAAEPLGIGDDDHAKEADRAGNGASEDGNVAAAAAPLSLTVQEESAVAEDAGVAAKTASPDLLVATSQGGGGAD